MRYLLLQCLVMLVLAVGACSTTQHPEGSDRFGSERKVYEAPFRDAVQGVADALFNLGLAIEGSTTLDEKAVLITAHQTHSVGGRRCRWLPCKCLSKS